MVVRKHESILIDDFLLLGFSCSSLLCLGDAIVLEISLVGGTFWARGLVEWDDEVVLREA